MKTEDVDAAALPGRVPGDERMVDHERGVAVVRVVPDPSAADGCVVADDRRPGDRHSRAAGVADPAPELVRTVIANRRICYRNVGEAGPDPAAGTEAGQ